MICGFYYCVQRGEYFFTDLRYYCFHCRLQWHIFSVDGGSKPNEIRLARSRLILKCVTSYGKNGEEEREEAAFSLIKRARWILPGISSHTQYCSNYMLHNWLYSFLSVAHYLNIYLLIDWLYISLLDGKLNFCPKYMFSHSFLHWCLPHNKNGSRQ